MLLRSLLTTFLVLAGLGAAAPVAGETSPEDLEWLAVHSQNFVIYTDATPERGAEIARNLELFRAVFARLAPGLELINPTPTKIIAFKNHYVYAPYKPRPDGNGNLILGYFLRHPDGNFLTLDAGTQLVGAFTVIYHEFVHYLVDHNFPKVPRWFNEGLAEYYSTFTVEDGSVYLGLPVERHVRWLRYDNRERQARLSHDFSLSQVLSGEAVEHNEKVGGFYAFSWALVHYLLSGSPERIDQTADFLLRLREGEDPENALERAFDVQLYDMEETLREYANKVRLDAIEHPLGGQESAEAFPVSRFRVEDFGAEPAIAVVPMQAPDVFFHLGDLLTRMGRLDDALLHFQKALELDPGHAETLAGIGLVRDLERRFDEAEVLYREAIRLESKDPLTYLRYGRHLIAQLRPEESAGLVIAGKLTVAASLASTSELATAPDLQGSESLEAARKAFEKAVRLDPDFAHARLLLGVSYLFGDVDPTPGIRSLQKVRQWLPDDDEASFFLLQLFLKKNDEKRALAIYDQVFRDHVNPEVTLRADEEIERARLLHRASAALEEGDAEQALRLFDEAIGVTSSQELRDRLSERLSVLQDRLAAPSDQPSPRGE